MTKDSIKAILVDLSVDGEPSLAVLLTDDGLVNRLGTGAVDNAERDLFIGRADASLFAELRDKVQLEWMAHPGTYDIPEKTGRMCELAILFKHADGQEVGLNFRYGSESPGPPSDICRFVAEAVDLTDPWYKHQKRIARRRNEAKPWWKIW